MQTAPFNKRGKGLLTVRWAGERGCTASCRRPWSLSSCCWGHRHTPPRLAFTCSGHLNAGPQHFTNWGVTLALPTLRVSFATKDKCDGDLLSLGVLLILIKPHLPAFAWQNVLFQRPGWRFGHQLYKHRGALRPYQPWVHEVCSRASGHPSCRHQCLWAPTRWGRWGDPGCHGSTVLSLTIQFSHFQLEPFFWSPWIWKGAESSQEKKVRHFVLEETCRELGRRFHFKNCPHHFDVYMKTLPPF